MVPQRDLAGVDIQPFALERDRQNHPRALRRPSQHRRHPPFGDVRIVVDPSRIRGIDLWQVAGERNHRNGAAALHDFQRCVARGLANGVKRARAVSKVEDDQLERFGRVLFDAANAIDRATETISRHDHNGHNRFHLRSSPKMS